MVGSDAAAGQWWGGCLGGFFGGTRVFLYDAMCRLEWCTSRRRTGTFSHPLERYDTCPLIAPYLGMLCFRNFCDLKNEGWEVIFNLGIPPVHIPRRTVEAPDYFRRPSRRDRNSRTGILYVFSITTRTSTWIASTKLVLFSPPSDTTGKIHPGKPGDCGPFFES